MSFRKFLVVYGGSWYLMTRAWSHLDILVPGSAFILHDNTGREKTMMHCGGKKKKKKKERKMKYFIHGMKFHSGTVNELAKLMKTKAFGFRFISTDPQTRKFRKLAYFYPQLWTRQKSSALNYHASIHHLSSCSTQESPGYICSGACKNAE